MICLQNGEGSGGNFHEWSSRRTAPAKPSASNIIASMTIEELKVYCEVPSNIDLRLMEGADESTLNGEYNGVFFTREHLVAGLRFPVPAMVKQFLHFTRVPPALIHPNVIRILVGCCVLNHLYQLDLTLVELLIIYMLNIGSGGRMFMLVLSPRLQIVNGLPDSPKTEAKGALLVRGPWDETSGSLGLPFNVNQSQSFPGPYLCRFCFVFIMVL